MQPKSMILSTGHSVPDRIMTNSDLEKMVETSDKWIFSRTGIKERRIKRDEENASDFCVKAALEALEESGLSPLDIDLILVATISGDMRFPSTAVFVQAKLGADNSTAFDIAAGCSGFIYGLSIAEQFINSGKMKHVLVIGSEMLSFLMDWKDRNTCVLFGDGVGAVILGPSDGKKGIIITLTASNGKLAHLLYSPGMGTASPPSQKMLQSGDHHIKMSGNDVFLYAIQAMGDIAEKALSTSGLKIEDIDLMIPHQANIRIIEAIAKRLNISKEKVFTNIQKYGNTSAASIPIAINEARKSSRIKDGDKVLLVTFGTGFTWAASIMQF